MEVSYTMLANYAEDNGGLVYIQGGNWDTITVTSPLEGGPPGAFALVRGFYVARLTFHHTEVGDHTFGIDVVDEDGGQVAKLEGAVDVQRDPSLPPTWGQPVNLIVPLTGMPLPKPGLFRISLKVDSTHQDEREFRVIKGF